MMFKRVLVWSIVFAAAFGLLAFGAMKATASVESLPLLSLVFGGMAGIAISLLSGHQIFCGYQALSGTHFLSCLLMLGLLAVSAYQFNALDLFATVYVRVSPAWAIGGGLGAFSLICLYVGNKRHERASASKNAAAFMKGGKL